MPHVRHDWFPLPLVPYSYRPRWRAGPSGRLASAGDELNTGLTKESPEPADFR